MTKQNSKSANNYIATKINKIEKETAKVKTFILDKKIIAKPGQYVMVWFPRVNEKPFGIVSDNPLTLSVANVGPFTKQMHQLKKGNMIHFRGPYGSSFSIRGKKILFIAGGYGVVPLYFLALRIMKLKHKKITVIIGAKTKTDLIFANKFKRLGCRVQISTDDGSAGFKGFSTQLGERLIDKEKFDSVYTCGPEIMMKKIAEICKTRKIFCQISMEKMFKCGGIGLCGECSCKGKLVCKDGPVFNGSMLIER